MDLTALSLQLGTLLQEKALKIAVAESCTGGWLAQSITDISGSSQWFDRGFVTYSNAAKQEMLGVNSESLDEFGAVSAEIVREMAEGVLRHSQANVSISISGIAGPSGGSLHKPVGLVWFGFASSVFPTDTISQQFAGDRTEVRAKAVAFALQTIMQKLLNN